MSVRSRSSLFSLLSCLWIAGAACSGESERKEGDETSADKRSEAPSAQPSRAQSSEEASASDDGSETDRKGTEQPEAAANGCADDNGGCGDPKYNRCRTGEDGAVECSALDPCSIDNGGCGDAKYHVCKGEKGRAPSCADRDECARDNGGCGDADVYSCENRRGEAPKCQRRVRMAAVGTDHACAIAGAGELYCWGANDSGQLGRDDFEPRTLPERVGADEAWSQVAAGAAVSCGVRAGKLYCWGDNFYNQLGAPATVAEKNVSPEPVQVGADEGWQAVAVGEAHVCGIRDKRLYCWGVNDLGQVGDGSAEDQITPSPIGELEGWSAVACGSTSTCAIRAGELHCWGDNSAGQLGDGTHTSHNVPERVGTANDWSQISVGGDSACGIRAGELHCWGDNTSGKLGLGTREQSTRPQRVGKESGWTSISVGKSEACGTRTDALYCWGDNAQDSRLGVDSTETLVATPARVGEMTGWTSVAGIGAGFYCAARLDQALYCWGDNRQGQLGSGESESRDEPTRVTLE